MLLIVCSNSEIIILERFFFFFQVAKNTSYWPSVRHLKNIAFRNILPSKFCQSGLYIQVHSSCMHCLWTLWEYPVLTSFYPITLHIILQFPYYPVKLVFQKDCTLTGRRVLGKKWAPIPQPLPHHFH